MLPRHSDSNRFEVTHIDVVPLVDCIMVLLIFLMVSSAFVGDPGIEVSRPDVGGTPMSDQNNLLIAIAADNRIFFDGQELRLDQVAEALRQAAVGKTPALVIRADKNASHGVFSAVYSEAKKAGLKHVLFATAKADGF